MPTEAVHVSGVPVMSTASRSTHPSEDSEREQRGARRASRGRGDDDKWASGDGEERAQEGRDANTSRGDGGGDGRSRQSGGRRSRSSRRRGKSAHVTDQSNGLPPGWQKGYDSLHRLYYYNSYLGESSWTPPPGSHLHARRGDTERRRRVSRRRVVGGDDDDERRVRHSSESGGRKQGDAGGFVFVARASAPPHPRFSCSPSPSSRPFALCWCACPGVGCIWVGFAVERGRDRVSDRDGGQPREGGSKSSAGCQLFLSPTEHVREQRAPQGQAR